MSRFVEITEDFRILIDEDGTPRYRYKGSISPETAESWVLRIRPANPCTVVAAV